MASKHVDTANQKKNDRVRKNDWTNKNIGQILEMEETAVGENLQRFVTIKNRHKSKKKVCGKIINTDVRVYSIVLKMLIPKHLNFGGKKTYGKKYTGQARHMQQRTGTKWRY